MTAQRRARNAFNGRRKWRQRRRNSQSTSDDGSSDGGSVTRCPCGEIHNVGLMVQCDKCEVWQHCDCVGLEEQDIPEQYYCEECKPENHSIITLNHGRTRRSYSSLGHAPSDRKAPKKRMTQNSREASISIETVLAARNVLATSLQRSTENLTVESPTEIIAENDDYGKRTKRQKGLDKSNEDEMNEEVKSQPPSSTVSSVGHEEPVGTVKPEDELNDSEAETPPSKPKRTQAIRLKPEETAESPPAMSIKPKRARNGKSRINGPTGRRGQSSKPRSRTSTPQPSEPHQQHGDISSSLFEHLSSHAREASPPARVRYPSGRMTIPEMNRRAKQILECISSMQLEMANKNNGNDNRALEKKRDGTQKPLTEMSGQYNKQSSPSRTNSDKDEIKQVNGDSPDPGAGTGKGRRQPQRKVDPITIPSATGAASPSSSLSSASTLPLDEANPPSPRYDFDEADKGTAQEAIERALQTTSPKAKSDQSSMEIMDLLTRELIKFQRRFGSGSYSHKRYDSNEGEDRVTQNKEVGTIAGVSRAEA